MFQFSVLAKQHELTKEFKDFFYTNRSGRIWHWRRLSL